MILYATLDTVIFGRSYHVGELVDDAGWVRAQYLQMLDLGLVTTATGTIVVNGPSQMEYAPSMPALGAAPHGYVTTWDGSNEDGSNTRPADWAWCEVHSSVAHGFKPDPSTMRGTFATPTGGTLVTMAGLEYQVGINDTYEVLLMYRNTAGVVSAPSPRAVITVGLIDPVDIPDLSLTVTKFKTLTHMLY